MKPQPPAPTNKPHHHVRTIILLLAVLVIAFVTRQYIAHYQFEPAQDETVREPPHLHRFSVFGSYAQLTFWGAESVCKSASREISSELQHLHERINLFDSESELSRLNRTAAEELFVCSPRLWELFQASRKAYEVTDGAFDVTVGPLMKVWGFHGRRETLPSDRDISRALESVGMEHIVFHEEKRAVTFTRAGTLVDFGGIAKGFGLDLAAEIAARHGIKRGLIDLGGNIYCLPTPPPGRETYTVGIRNPLRPDSLIGAVKVLDRCIATSGSYEQYRVIDGQRFSHIVDPRTGQPVKTMAGVTVVTPAGVFSDAFSTAVFSAGADLAHRLRDRYQQTGILMITLDEDGNPSVEKENWPWKVQLKPAKQESE